VPEEQNEQNQVEFISAQYDADIRLRCFTLVDAGGQMDFEHRLEYAKTLYNWVMDFEASTDDVAEPGSAISED
jgi:hypothetical protein